MPGRVLPLPFALDLRRSLRPLRLGRQDPTIDLRASSVAVAMSTPAGPATLRARHLGHELSVDTWGEGADWAVEHSPGLLGLLDDRAGFEPHDAVVEHLHAEGDGLRMPATGRVVDALVQAIVSQEVSTFEARRSYRSLVDRWGSPAPGPLELRLPPPPELIAELGYYDLHVIGVEQLRADALKRACAHAGRLEQVPPTTDPSVLRERLGGITGVSPAAVAEVVRVALGDADAVPVGDAALAQRVCAALSGEPHGTEERMLELLEPYRGHRARVCNLVETSVSRPSAQPRWA